MEASDGLENLDKDACSLIIQGRESAEQKDYIMALKHFADSFEYLHRGERRPFDMEYMRLIIGGIKTEGFMAVKHFLKEARKYFSRNFEVYKMIAEILFENKCYQEASEAFHIAMYSANEKHDWLRVFIGYENVRTYLFDQWHWRMMNDGTRNKAFAGAIKDAVAEARSIFGTGQIDGIDLGCGSGILSVMLYRELNKYQTKPVCHAIECNPALNVVSERVFCSNGKCYKEVNLQEIHSSKFTVERRCEVLVSETLDCAIFGEKILSSLVDAWERLLVPNACIVPQSAKYYVALLQSPDIEDQHWHRTGDFVLLSMDCYVDGASADTLPNPYDCAYLTELDRGFRIRSDPVELFSVDFTNPLEMKEILNGKLAKTFKLTAKEAGRVCAVAGWFECQVGPNHRLSMEPGMDSCWAQAIWPFHPFVDMNPGDSLEFNMFVRNERMYIRPVKLPRITVQPLRASDDLNLPIMNYPHIRKFYADSLEFLRQNGWPLIGYDCTDLLMVQHLGEMASEIRICSDRPILRYVRSKSVDYSHYDGSTPDIILLYPFNVRGLADYDSIFRIQRILNGRARQQTQLIPSHLVLRGYLVSSEELWRRGSLVPEAERDETYCGVRMTPTSQFQIHYYEAVDLRKIPHRKMSEQIELMEVDLMELILSQDEERTIRVPQSVKATEAGLCHALVYWFDMFNYECGTGFSLLSLHEHAIGYYLPVPKRVEVGDTLDFTISSARLQQFFEFPDLNKEVGCIRAPPRY